MVVVSVGKSVHEE